MHQFLVVVAGAFICIDIGASSQILGDGLELVDCLPLVTAKGSDCLVEKVIKVIIDQRPLRICDRFLHGVKLL